MSKLEHSDPVRAPNLPERSSEAVRDAIRGPASRLPESTRQSMQARFNADFADVRIHADRPAAQAARALGARAFTVGRHIAFAAGEYERGGQRLLAHELAHAQQQREAGDVARGASLPALGSARDDAHEALADRAAEHAIHGRAVAPIAALSGGARVQADKPKKGEAAATPVEEQPVGPTLNIVIRAPDDAFTQDVTDYLQKTLGEDVIAVDNIQEAVKVANEFAKKNNTKVGKIRLVGHGTAQGGISMTPSGETGRRFVTAEELEKMAADQTLKNSADEAMADGATVEFWGCFIGQSEKSTGAVADIFQSDVKAIDATLRTEHDNFARPADHGEEGKKIKGREGKWVKAVSTSEIDFRVKEGNKSLGESFNNWLRAQAARLEKSGELPPQPDDATRIATMRALFDRTGGTIKRAQISSGGKNVDRSDKKKWAEKWKTKKVK